MSTELGRAGPGWVGSGRVGSGRVSVGAGPGAAAVPPASPSLPFPCSERQRYPEETVNILKSAFTGGIVGWMYGGLPAFYQARKAFIERSHGELFHNRADAVVRAPPPAEPAGPGVTRGGPGVALGGALGVGSRRTERGSRGTLWPPKGSGCGTSRRGGRRLVVTAGGVLGRPGALVLVGGTTCSSERVPGFDKNTDLFKYVNTYSLSNQTLCRLAVPCYPNSTRLT